MRSEGGVELLLLLCCMAGVVAFFSLGLAMTNALAEESDGLRGAGSVEELEKLRDEKEAELNVLVRERERLEEELSQMDVPVPEPEPASEREQRAELERLEREHEELTRRANELRAELSALEPLPDASEKEERERELRALEERLDELTRAIAEKQQRLNEGTPKDPSSTSASDLAQLGGRLEELRKARRGLEKEIEAMDLRATYVGSSKADRPLFVECVDNAYVFYPAGHSVSADELESRDVFKERSAGHDMVVLLVRPNGFASFRKAYEKVKAISIALCYEPIDAGQSLDALKG